ncbi:MAG: hypothetical protein QOH01_1313 [Verrucomicrobiota bacterium]|jgi:uncharacterized membrane protein YfcA
MATQAKAPTGCLIICGLLLVVTGLLLFAKAHTAAVDHTVIHDKIKPAYYTPAQAYFFGLVSLSLGVYFLVVPFVRRDSKKAI